jgi:hypothetical protein
MLHSIIQRAVRGLLDLDQSMRAHGLPKVVLRRSRTLTPEEFDQLIQAIPERHRLMVETAIETGMRWGECSGHPGERQEGPADRKRSSASDGKGREELSSCRIILAVSFVILAAVVVVVLTLARMNLVRLTLQIVRLRVKK